jgi:hypothetical protein
MRITIILFFILVSSIGVNLAFGDSKLKSNVACQKFFFNNSEKIGLLGMIDDPTYVEGAVYMNFPDNLNVKIILNPTLTGLLARDIFTERLRGYKPFYIATEKDSIRRYILITSDARIVENNKFICSPRLIVEQHL